MPDDFRTPTKSELHEAIDKAHDKELAELRARLAEAERERDALRQDYDMVTVEIDGYKKAIALMSKGMEASEDGRMECKLKSRGLESDRDELRRALGEAMRLLKPLANAWIENK